MTACRVTAVIVNYNGLTYLGDCLRSIFATAYRDFDVIVVDNASRDASVSYVEQNFPSVRIIVNKTNVGYAEGCNVGARAATGEYIAFLNTDIEVDPEWLGALLGVAVATPKIGACGPKVLRLGARDTIDVVGGFLCDVFGYPFEALGHSSLDHGQYSQVREVFALAGMCMLVSRAAFDRVGGFDRRFFLLAEDIDLCWRLRLAGYKIRVATGAVVLHESMATFKQEKVPREYVRFLVERNTMRMIIKNYGLGSLMIILPAQVLMIIAEMSIYLFMRRFNYLREVGLALLWNARNIRDTLESRRRVQRTRLVKDTEIMRHMTRRFMKMAHYRNFLATTRRGHSSGTGRELSKS